MAAHSIRFRVYYEDTDAGGIVYHARYLAFAERARAEALRAHGLAVGDLAEKEGIGFVVRWLSVCYHAPLRLDEMLEVETALVEEAAARLTLKQQITNLSQGGKLAASLEVKLVCLRVEGMRPVRIPSVYRSMLRQLGHNPTESS